MTPNQQNARLLRVNSMDKKLHEKPHRVNLKIFLPAQDKSGKTYINRLLSYFAENVNQFFRLAKERRVTAVHTIDFLTG